MAYEEIVESIKSTKFNEHKALIDKQGNLKIIEWSKGESRNFIRYVFNNNYIYITGDLGNAIVRLTCEATLEFLSTCEIGYFISKIVTCDRETKIFSSVNAVESLEEWKEQLEENCDIEFDSNGNEILKPAYDTHTMNNLFIAAAECHDLNDWNQKVFERYYNFIYECDPYAWEWIGTAGDCFNPTLISYLVGLKMIYKQQEELEVNKNEHARNIKSHL